MSVAVPFPAPGAEPVDPITPVLDDYLDRLRAPLVGLVPLERRHRFLCEVAGHLEALVEDFVQEGDPPEAAVRRAIQEHGEPGRIAEAFLATWYEKEARGAIERRMGRANCTAFAAFVVVQSGYLLVLQVRVFEPNGAFYRFPFSPGQIRQMWPAPLPYPEASPWFAFLIGYPIIAPLLAGWWTGRQVPVRAAYAVYQALVPLILTSFAVGVFLLPVTEGLLFALVQLLFWLPGGAAAAHVSSVLARIRRVSRSPQ